jgi:trimeric autotransporter adhesin
MSRSSLPTKINVMRKRLISLLLLCAGIFLPATIINAQMGVNTDASPPHASAMLDVKSTTTGLLIPRLDKTQRNAIVSPATGLLVYQHSPDSTGFHYYDGTQWRWLDSLAWKISGNPNINSSHFLGTTNDAALRFRVKNIPSGIVDSTSENTSLGFRTGLFTTGKSNIAIGNMAGRNITTSSNNTAVGFSALGSPFFNPNGAGGNTAVGSWALESVHAATGSTGSYNTAIGRNALRGALENTGSSNTAVGLSSMQGGLSGLITANDNTAVGVNSLYQIGSGSRNVALGISAMHAVSTANSNVALGYWTLGSPQSASNNVMIGEYAGSNIASGNLNVAIGYQAMSLTVNRSNNVAIGTQALFNNGQTVPPNNVVLGIDNVAVGDSALRWNFIGYGQTAIGASALFFCGGFNNVGMGKNTLSNSNGGNQNVAIGNSALQGIVNSSSNTALGDNANAPFNNVVNTRTNTTVIGANAWADVINAMVLGSINGINGATTSTNVGVGTTMPAASLHVNSDFILGANSAVLSNILKTTEAFDIPSLAGGATTTATFTVTNAGINGVVYISPASDLASGIMIASARVSAANTVEIKFSNITAGAIDPANMNFHISVIQ